MVVILNSFVMSSLPPDNLDTLLDIGVKKKPLRTIEDVQERLNVFLELADGEEPRIIP